MTRKKEINNFARNYANDNYKGDSYEAYAEQGDITEACISAAEWADNNPNPEYKEKIVNEVCDWLKNHINDYLVKGRDIDYIFDDLRNAILKSN